MKPKFSNPPNQSKGILDDHAVRKSETTRELNVQKVFLPNNDKKIKFYASDKTTLIAILDEVGNFIIKGRFLKM